jgi:hypothetical protein
MVCLTLELPPHKLDHLNELLVSVPETCTRISAKRWHRLLRELRSMLLAFLGARGLFSTLEEAFRHLTRDGRLKLSPAVCWLARDLGTRPTRIAELTPLPESTLGACDAQAMQPAQAWAGCVLCPHLLAPTFNCILYLIPVIRSSNYLGNFSTCNCKCSPR